jgi:spermidine/putrescine-binding protein
MKQVKKNICNIILCLLGNNVYAEPITLKILEWEGYISPFITEFETYAKTQGMEVKLEILKPFIANPEQIFQAARDGSADVLTPTHNYYHMSNGALMNELLPIQYDKLSNYEKILPALRISNYDLNAHNKKCSVPLLGGSYGLAYNTDKTKSVPTSWRVLWDPANKGLFSITDEQFEANIYIAMTALGYPPATFYDIDNKSHPFNEVQVQEKLNALVKNAGSFWGGLEDINKMKNLHMITTYWFEVGMANAQGQHWKLATLKEGETVWCDTIAISRHIAEDKISAAHMLLNFMISDEIQAKIFKMYGSMIPNRQAVKLLTAEELENSRVGDENFFKPEWLWQPLTARTRNLYKQMWTKAKSAAGL